MEAHKGIWGGEGVILGNKRRKQWFEVYPTRWSLPILNRSVVYSEILDKRLSVIVTKRTIELIVQHQGFDNYILEVSQFNVCFFFFQASLKFKVLSKSFCGYTNFVFI